MSSDLLDEVVVDIFAEATPVTPASRAPWAACSRASTGPSPASAAPGVPAAGPCAWRVRLGALLGRLAALSVIAAIAASLLFWATGGRWMTVTTPSMGETAPVGTLILSRPTAAADIAVGDFIVFHPPTAPRESYSHRVVAIDAIGIHTQGDINGTQDPWAVHDADLIGRVVFRVWGGGYFMQLIPLLLVGGFTVFFLARSYAPRGYRIPVVTVGLALISSLALVVVRPLVKAVTLSQLAENGTAATTLVPTGLLPVHIQAYGGEGLDLRPGEVGRVVSSTLAGDGKFQTILTPHLTPTLWAVFIVIWGAPFVVCTVAAIRLRKNIDE